MNKEAIFCLINGQLILVADAKVYVNDLAIQRGYGIFDFFKVVYGHPIFLDEHITRFLFSAKEMHLEAGITKELLVEQITRLQNINHLPESGIRLTLTGGYAQDGYSLSAPNLIITQNPLVLPRVMPPAINLMTHLFQRQMPRVKTIDYLMAIWLQPLIREKAAQDVLYISDGAVRECPRANFFIINKMGELQTTKKKLLWGITRKKVLGMARELVPVAEKDITMNDLLQAREAFITSTTKHITPVAAIDGRMIANGQPGEYTQLLSERLLKQVFKGH